MPESHYFTQLSQLFKRLDPHWDACCDSVLLQLISAQQEGHVACPLSAVHQQRLQQSPLVGSAGAYAPLIVEKDGWAYLARYWLAEVTVAKGLMALAGRRLTLAADQIRPTLEALFPMPSDVSSDAYDDQKMAAALALRQHLMVISGGPGSGKTSTVARLLVLLLSLSAHPLVIVLAAPTGKAATRLEEAVQHSYRALNLSAKLYQQLPQQASTLHRLLGLRVDTMTPRYHARRPLALDVLVIDEASMINLPLMAQILAALPPHAHLILLGDRDQLAPVEVGMGLADICQHISYRPESLQWLKQVGCTPPKSDMAPHPLADCIALLTYSRRFADDSGIGHLSRLVKAGKGKEAVERFMLAQHQDILSEEQIDIEGLTHARRAYIQAAQKGEAPDIVFGLFNHLMLLAHERQQVDLINQSIEQNLERMGHKRPGQTWYAGRPIMVTRNDYSVELFNGNIGLTLQTPQGLRVVFPLANGHWQAFSPARLPEHETAFALTIHKSQGSEVDHVCLILPTHPSTSLNRALIYTALTRAKKRFTVYGHLTVLQEAIDRGAQRYSKLAVRLMLNDTI